MSVGYSLYIQTESKSREVLAMLFPDKAIEPIAGTDLLYTRGSVFLAHGRDCVPEDPQVQKMATSFGLLPTVNIPFFPDGVSNFQTALNHLLDATLKIISTTSDPLLLVANHRDLVLQRDAVGLRLAAQHAFWTAGRLERVSLPYEAV